MMQYLSFALVFRFAVASTGPRSSFRFGSGGALASRGSNSLPSNKRQRQGGQRMANLGQN